VIAMLGDVVKPGDPLFVIHASEFVQAQNDLITALANFTAARSQLTMAQTTEKRAHELYLTQGGAVKDWQQAQTDLITAQNTVRSDEIALHAVRSRLRILGKSVIVGGIMLAPVLILIVMPVLIDLFSRRRAPVGAPQPLPSPAE
jgi:cobalt-zinc-cadmium efflux system membrane fusion protein